MGIEIAINNLTYYNHTDRQFISSLSKFLPVPSYGPKPHIHGCRPGFAVYTGVLTTTLLETQVLLAWVLKFSFHLR